MPRNPREKTRRRTNAEPARLMTTFMLGGEPVALPLPGDLTHRQVAAPQDVLLADLLRRLRGGRLLEVGSSFGLAGLAALERGWAKRVVWVMRDALGGRVLRDALEARHSSPDAAILGEGPLDAPDEAYDGVIVHQQPSRALTETLIRQAASRLAPDGTLLVAGEVREGIKVSARVVDEVCAEARGEVVAQGARVVSGWKPRAGEVMTAPLPRAHHAAEVAGVSLRWVTTPGIFSADGLDPASRFLLETIRLPHKGRILDVGCGAGVLGLWCALRMPQTTVTMLDSDVASVRCAEEGIRLLGLTNARAVLSDGIRAVADERFDVVVTNPPMHWAGKQDTRLVGRFVRDAAQVIGRKGRVWMVCAPTLSLMPILQENFTEASIAGETSRFRVWNALRRPLGQAERNLIEGRLF